MDPPSRPPDRSRGPAAVTATEERRAGAPAQSSRSNTSGGSTGAGEPLSPARCRGSSSSDGLDVFQKRSIFFHRSCSSGYFSFDSDSLPGSPRPLTADRATQTPSPSGQVMTHAWHRMDEAHGGGAGPRRHGHPRSPFRRQSAGAAMQAEDVQAVDVQAVDVQAVDVQAVDVQAVDVQAEAVGQMIRLIGDDFNTHLILRGAVRRQAPAPPEPAVLLLCLSVLLLVIGRLIYLQGSTRPQDHSQV